MTIRKDWVDNCITGDEFCCPHCGSKRPSDELGHSDDFRRWENQCPDCKGFWRDVYNAEDQHAGVAFAGVFFGRPT